MGLKILVAGGTGWAGSALSKAIFNDKDLNLVGAISRKNAGKNLADILELGFAHIPIHGDIEGALSKTEFDILVEYTKPEVAKKNIIAALQKKKRVVVGTSGLTDNDYAEVEAIAQANNTSVLAVGNFAITAVLLQKFSEMAAKYIPNYEIVDYAHERKADSPSGTARELANRLSNVQESKVYLSEDQLLGLKESRGARLHGVQIHSVRLPGHVLSVETIFGLKDEKLTIRHDAGASAEPYVQGGLLAIKKVGTFKGLRRGLDSVMEF